MKINQKLVKERLSGVEPKHRSFIYDASIVIEFLRTKYMPVKYFFPDVKAVPGEDLVAGTDFKRIAKQHPLLMRDLYQLYVLWREERDYTRKIETRYVFSLIIRHLRFYQNGWELYVFRVGKDQIWHAGPLVLRMDVPAEERGPIPEPVTADQTTVEADPIQEPSEEETPQEEQIEPVKSVENEASAFIEAGKEIADRDSAAILQSGTETVYTEPPKDLPEF